MLPLKQLHAALLDAFSAAGFDRMLRHELGRSREQIAIGSSLGEIIDGVLLTAQREGWLDDLVAAAVRANPGNQPLAAAAAAWRAAQAQPDQPVPPANPQRRRSTLLFGSLALLIVAAIAWRVLQGGAALPEATTAAPAATNPDRVAVIVTASPSPQPSGTPGAGAIIFNCAAGSCFVEPGDPVVHLFVAEIQDVAWSPDGSRLAYAAAGAYGKHQIVIVEQNQTIATTALEAENASRPAWSPDGSQVVFSTDAEQIMILDVEGGSVRTVGRGIEPAWSPDGQMIAACAGAPLALHLIPLTGGEPRLLLQTTGDTCDPAFAPDGRTLFYGIHGDGGAWSIRELAVADGRPGRVVADAEANYRMPTVVDADTLVALRLTSGAGMELVRIRFEGTAYTVESLSRLETTPDYFLAIGPPTLRP